jgi:hypothetical protein
MPKSKPEIPDFGINWAKVWPQNPNPTLLQRHHACAYHNCGNGSFWHRRALIQAFWPEEVFAWHDWSDRMLRSTCDYEVATWIGAAGTSKTTTAAALGLEWWLEAPFESSLKACSTTIKMLRLRIWSEFSRLFYALPKAVQFQNPDGDIIETCKMGYVGELVDSDLMIRWRQGDNKHAIFGFGVNEGSVAEAVSNLVGVHTRRMWLMLDELQGVRPAIEVAKNNMAKNPVFRVLGMGNTDENMQSLLRLSATPIKGWESVDATTADSWETDGGVVAEKGIALRLDGRKSPGVTNPAKYPFLITQKQLDTHLKSVRGNESDPGYCSQCLAIWPALGLQSTVLDDNIIEKFKCRESAVWTSGYQSGAALDPAFEGQDSKILQFFKFGLVADDEGERWMIELGEWVQVPIDSTSPEPIHYQIVGFCKGVCEAKGLTSDEFAEDSTGEGGGLKAIFDTEWGVIMGVEFGGAPSDRLVAGYKTVNGQRVQQTAKDKYDRRVTELCYDLREFALGNGLRGLSKETEEQACSRKTVYKNKKNTVEQKKDMKARGLPSPGHLDAAAVACAYVIANGAVPGGSSAIISRKTQSVMKQLAAENAAMTDERNYLVPQY